MRVVTAMSGGVDSSVAAALLQWQGFEVIGLSMQIWADYCSPGRRSCCSPAHLDDARAVAERLGIPHYVINFQEAFEHSVVEPFCQAYFAGRTPNPCIACNHELKFRLLWERARALGARYLATGHYARVAFDRRQGGFRLQRGADPEKDQSYFLFTMDREMLARTIFPLWEYRKAQVREIARSLELPVAEKSESQEICFIPAGGYREFLRKRHPQQLQRGDILDQEGKKLGEHEGIALYTIGQRRGLGVYASHPLYVTAIDARRNVLVVGEEAQLYQPCLLAAGGNLEDIKAPLRVQAQIRYRHRAAEAVVYPLDAERVLVEFAEPQRAITPGQAVVFYRGDRLLGGAWIERAGDRKTLLCEKNWKN